MDDEIKLKLIDTIEYNVCGLLIAKGYCTAVIEGKDLTFSELRLTDKGRLYLGNLKVDEIDHKDLINFLSKYRKLFEPSSRASVATLIQRYNKWKKITKHTSLSYDEILSYTEEYLINTTFSRQAHYFFVKHDKRTSSVIYPLEDFIDSELDRKEQFRIPGNTTIISSIDTSNLNLGSID